MNDLQFVLSRGNKIFFVRHSLAAPAAEGQEDFNRPLTQKGRELAKKTRKEIDLSKVVYVAYNPAIRCKETADVLMDGLKTSRLSMPLAYGLHPDSPGREVIFPVFLQIRDSSLADYAKHGCAEAFTLHATTILGYINSVLNDLPELYGDLMIVTHGTMAAALALHLGQALKFNTDEVMNFKPTECMVITVSKDGITCHDSQLVD